MHPILPSLMTFTGLLLGRVYALRDPDGVTLVDTGLALAAPRVLRQLARAGLAPQAVRRIVVTHAHVDHVGGLPALHAATGAAVWAHEAEAPIIAGEAPLPEVPAEGLPLPWRRWRQRAQHLAPVPVARTLRDGEPLPIGGGLEVLHTPGHAPGHLSLWHPTQRYLITGDTVLHYGGRLHPPFAAFTPDPVANRRSLQRLAALEPELLLFGHGVPIRRNAAARLRAFAASQRP